MQLLSDWLLTEELVRKIREEDLLQYEELEQSQKDFDDKITKAMNALMSNIFTKSLSCQQAPVVAEARKKQKTARLWLRLL